MTAHSLVRDARRARLRSASRLDRAVRSVRAVRSIRSAPREVR